MQKQQSSHIRETIETKIHILIRAKQAEIAQIPQMELDYLADSYHHSEDVAMHGLVIQPLRGVQDARSRVQAELAQAEGIGAAQQRVGQLVFLVSVHGADLQDLGARWLVLGDTHNVHLLGELRPVVVGVDDPNEHLKKENDWIVTNYIGSHRQWKVRAD